MSVQRQRFTPPAGARYVGALALVAVALAPSSGRGQEAEPGPGVVPPSAAYIGETSDSLSVLPRWKLEGADTRVLWVHFSDPPDHRPAFWAAIERAVDTWNEVPGIPISFRRTDHSDRADVRFQWVGRFDANQAGTTDWQTDGEGWLSSAVVTLAVEHADGTPMSDEFLLLVALHELGHVVGLPHSEDPLDVMHPGNRSRELSERDVRSAQRLYSDEPSGSPETP